MTILVTGGAGFIGSNFILNWFDSYSESIVNIDKLGYASRNELINPITSNPGYSFFQADILDSIFIDKLLKEFQPRAIIHFAAESHVDKSIDNPIHFIESNILGTFSLLSSATKHMRNLGRSGKDFRFFHISTDEVFGTLNLNEPSFKETNQYLPNSPYSASKASSDHLVRAWGHTYGLPYLITNCSNNYGPYQYPEKLIPLTIKHALEGKQIPVYGDGLQIRDWLYVMDHCDAIKKILTESNPFENYNIGGLSEQKNIDVVRMICGILDELTPNKVGTSYSNQITHVKDRPGHDKRYAIDSSKINFNINWLPKENFKTGLLKTINWYLENLEFLKIRS